jgi:hypothetical protein
MIEEPTPPGGSTTGRGGYCCWATRARSWCRVVISRTWGRTRPRSRRAILGGPFVAIDEVIGRSLKRPADTEAQDPPPACGSCRQRTIPIATPGPRRKLPRFHSAPRPSNPIEACPRRVVPSSICILARETGVHLKAKQSAPSFAARFTPVESDLRSYRRLNGDCDGA